MLLFSLAALLTLGVCAALVWPLLRARRAPPSAEAFNREVYKDQLKELARDVEREALPASEAVAARLEIERRLLAGARRVDAEGAERPAPWPAAAALALAVPLAAAAVYLTVGKPAAPDQPLSARAASEPNAAGATGQSADAAHAQMDALVAKLDERMRAHPEDPAGWALLARSLVKLDRLPDAVHAYREAWTRSGGGDDRLAGEYAEARVLAEGGAVDAEALALFKRRLAADPRDPQARYYLALAKAEGGDPKGALADWRKLKADSPPGAPWLSTLEGRIAEADPGAAPRAPSIGGGGPTGPSADAIRQMGPGDQRAMIEGMVASLAARLKTTPDDLGGWRRLARAYAVMGRRADAERAYAQVLRLSPADADARAALRR